MVNRTFASLRGGNTIKPEASTDEPIRRVLKRVFAAGDGRRVRDWMIAATHGPSPHGASDAVLREQEGARRFVAALCELIDKPEPDLAE